MQHDLQHNDLKTLERLMSGPREEYRALRHHVPLRELAKVPARRTRNRRVALVASAVVVLGALAVALFQHQSPQDVRPLDRLRLAAQGSRNMPLSLRPEGRLAMRLAFNRPRALQIGLGLHLPRQPSGYNL